MTPNPFAGLVRSRKFWLAMMDVVVTLLLFFVGKYLPAYKEDVLVVIGAIQPVFLVIIGAIAYEDVGRARAGGGG